MKRLTIILATLLALSFPSQAGLPTATVQNIQGRSVQVSELTNNGRPIIISFFATWCKPCMRELKAIHEYYADWQDELGIKMIIVSVDEAQDIMKVKPLVDGYGWEYEVLLDTGGEFKRAMNVQSIPHMFIVDGSGNIVYNHTGYTDGFEAELDELLHSFK